ncbi:sensor histidine kinase [Amycolatopsis sp. NPDC058278]|uniref:sensor histidine kinase n=1 Tax=Amycolatopsis sp. NPDC058278 TaxID=3346417 RepID=UPI0036DEB240
MDTALRTRAGGSAAFGFVAAGVSVQLITLGTTAALWLGLHLTDVKFARDVVLGGVIFTALVLLAASPVLTAVQRNRLRAVLDVDITPVTARRWTWRGLTATGRQLGYHAVVAPVLAAYALLVAIVWAAGVVVTGIVAYLLVFPITSLLRPPGDAGPTALGVVRPVLAAAPRMAGIVAQLDVWAADALLGPSRLQRRVVDLTESRAGVVDAADAERRRIERDLHDGAQQRLVSLAMNLGLARAGLPGLPDEAKQVIADAHEEAKEALAELRTLVRGLHPAILDDRGLDAALSGIAARAPVPVRLRVDVLDRASPTVEAVAYFMVAEALANIAKHAHATCAEIDVRRHDGVLTVTVTDDGTGGADPSGGTGLAGLAHRVRSVDGTLSVSSPAGGPTIVSAELPCAS